MAYRIVSERHPALYRSVENVTPDELKTPEIRRLISAMWRIMRNPEARGIGLAAPQLGRSLSIITIEDTAETMAHLTPAQRRARERKPFPARTLVNPNVELTDVRETYFFEGCLTFPGRMRAVGRYRGVHVDALDENGEPVEFEAEGWQARVVLHEVHHIEGVTLANAGYLTCGPWISIEEFRRQGLINLTSEQIRERYGLAA